MGDKTTYWGQGPDGEILPDGTSVTADTRTIEEARLEAKFNSGGALEAQLQAGYYDDVTGKWWQTDPESRANWVSVGAAAQNALAAQSDELFSLIAADNTIVELNAADTQALLSGRLMPYVSNLIVANRRNKDEIETLQTNEECDSFDVTARM